MHFSGNQHEGFDEVTKITQILTGIHIWNKTPSVRLQRTFAKLIKIFIEVADICVFIHPSFYLNIISIVSNDTKHPCSQYRRSSLPVDKSLMSYSGDPKLIDSILTTKQKIETKNKIHYSSNAQGPQQQTRKCRVKILSH